MKSIVLVTALLLHSILSFGQIYFEWYNKDKNVSERINFQSGNYEILRVNKGKTFKSQFKLYFEGVVIGDIQPNYSVNVFPKGKLSIITIPGTGQVYEFDISKKSLKRIDKTFYRGYNFKAIQFIENDTLFSLGGTGFWQYQNVLTYFDPSFSEWEVIYTKGEKPEGVYSNSAGISDNKVFAIEKLRELDDKDTKKKTQLFQFDIKSKSWSHVGELNAPLLSENEVNSPDFQWSENHLFFLHSKEPIYADVAANKVYKYNESRNGFLSSKGKIYISKGWVYTFRNDQNKVSLDSISYSELQRNSILLGPLYLTSHKAFADKWFYIISFLIIDVIGLSFVYRYRLSRKRKSQKGPSNSIPKYLDKLLEVYKLNGSDYLITTEELSRIIECDSMAFDTQRQYRSKFISSVNTYASDTFGISNAIFRINHDSDKRFIQYGIKKELFALIDGILV